jgi:hypothetical protein
LLSTQGCFFWPADYFLNGDGIILGSLNRPVGGAEIVAKPFGDPQYANYFVARSRADGCFSFDGFAVAPQQWVPLTVVAPGYKSVAQQVPGTGSIHVIVTLVPEGSGVGDGKVLLLPDEPGSNLFPQCKEPRPPCPQSCSDPLSSQEEGQMFRTTTSSSR